MGVVAVALKEIYLMMKKINRRVVHFTSSYPIGTKTINLLANQQKTATNGAHDSMNANGNGL